MEVEWFNTDIIYKKYNMEHFNRLSQHATALSQTGMGIVGELTKMATSISNFQGEHKM